jgi:hypothetical protein
LPAAIKTAISLLGLFLLMHSLALGADLFQWTDARGVIHLHRQFRFRSGVGAPVREPYCAPGLLFPSGSVIGPAPTTYTPQEIIVGVNSDAQQQVKQLWCVGNKCNPLSVPASMSRDLCNGVLSLLAPRQLCQVRQVRLLLGKETGVSSCRDSFSSTASPQLNTRQNGNRKTFLLHSYFT